MLILCTSTFISSSHSKHFAAAWTILSLISSLYLQSWNIKSENPFHAIAMVTHLFPSSARSALSQVGQVTYFGLRLSEILDNERVLLNGRSLILPLLFFKPLVVPPDDIFVIVPTVVLVSMRNHSCFYPEYHWDHDHHPTPLIISHMSLTILSMY